MFIYKIDLLKRLKDAGYTSTRIRKEKLISQSTLQTIREHKYLGINELEKLCRMLDLQPGDILHYVSEQEYEQLKESNQLEPFQIMRE